MLLREMFSNVLLWLVFFVFTVLGVKAYVYWCKTKMSLVKDLTWVLLLATYVLGLSVLFLFCLEVTM